MNGVYFYFVNKLFLVCSYWDFKQRALIHQLFWKKHSCLFKGKLNKFRGAKPFGFGQHFLLSHLIYHLTLSQTSLVFTCLQYKSFENTVGKGEIAHNEQFLFFPQCFLSILENFLPLSSHLK